MPRLSPMVPPGGQPAKSELDEAASSLIVEPAASAGLALHVPLRIVLHVTEPSFPGAVTPQRRATVESLGVRLNLLEWGDPEGPPLVLTHGMWDHARSFAVFAPL